MFQSLFVCCAFEAKFLPLKLHCHVHINVCTYNVCTCTCALVQSIRVCVVNDVVCSRKVEAVLLAASVSFLSPMLLNPSRNSNRNKTSTCYKAIIQFWRHSISTLIKTHVRTFGKCVHFCWRSFECCFATFVPSLVQMVLPFISVFIALGYQYYIIVLPVLPVLWYYMYLYTIVLPVLPVLPVLWYIMVLPVLPVYHIVTGITSIMVHVYHSITSITCIPCYSTLLNLFLSSTTLSSNYCMYWSQVIRKI